MTINQEDITILSMFAPNNIFARHLKQDLIELKGEIDESTITVRDFTRLSTIDAVTRQKVSMDIEEL